jgi:hypothetical protein
MTARFNSACHPALLARAARPAAARSNATVSIFVICIIALIARPALAASGSRNNRPGALRTVCQDKTILQFWPTSRLL